VCDHPLQYRTIPTSIELALSSFQGGLPTTQSYWVAYASPAQDAFGSNEFPSKTFPVAQRRELKIRLAQVWRSDVIEQRRHEAEFNHLTRVGVAIPNR
jgi:hypothetical protein